MATRGSTAIRWRQYPPSRSACPPSPLRILVATPLEDSRLFLCAQCRKQVRVCRPCDRGQIYCAGECSASRRAKTLRDASGAYQRTSLGARNHARRQRRYRARRKKVTHQGSPPFPSAPACLAAILITRLLGVFRAAHEPREGNAAATASGSPCCHFCGRPVSEFVRFDHSSTEAPG